MSNLKKITVSKNGPYIVSGSVPLAPETIGTNSKGESTKWIEGESIQASTQYALCRCGASKTKPFCDGAHAQGGFAQGAFAQGAFDGTETASRKPVIEQAQIIDGPAMKLADVENLCAFARFCDSHGQVWNQVQNTDDPKVRAQFILQVGECPSGRLMAIDNKTGQSIEPQYPQSIGVEEDPAQKCSGPLWVRGGIPLVSSDGETYEVRNRMTLCRCGRSENKPFCNGAHAADPKFKDGRV